MAIESDLYFNRNMTFITNSVYDQLKNIAYINEFLRQSHYIYTVPPLRKSPQIPCSFLGTCTNEICNKTCFALPSTNTILENDRNESRPIANQHLYGDLFQT